MYRKTQKRELRLVVMQVLTPFIFCKKFREVFVFMLMFLFGGVVGVLVGSAITVLYIYKK